MLLALPPLAAEHIFTLGPLPVTNSMINAWIGLVIFAVFALVLRAALNKQKPEHNAPRGIVNFAESLLEFVLGYIDGVTRDRKKSLKFLPIVGSIFFFILISNWMGLLPGTGSIGLREHAELIPLLRPANTDLNLTLAIAVFAVIASHILGIVTIGFFKYANKFIKVGDLWHAVASLKPMNMMIAFIEFFVGLIEVFSEIAKMVSLSLRLFGNIFAGEVLLTVLGSLIAGYGAFFIPIPFMLLELLVGFIQATVFSMLTLVYLSVATEPVHGHDAGHEASTEHGLEAETAGLRADTDETPTV